MDPLSHRRLVLLFLVVVILPSVILVALGLRMIGQEHELAEKRHVEERQRIASNLGQQLLVRLERIKLEVVRERSSNMDSLPSFFDHTDVVVVGLVDENQLILPWDTEVSVGLQSGSAVYSRKIRQGKNAEFVRKLPGEAGALYQDALESAQNPTQLAYARLSLARTLIKEGRVEQGLEHHKTLLQLAPDVRDEYGVPYSFYATSVLLGKRMMIRDILGALESSVTSSLWLSPIASNMLGEFADTLAEISTADSLRDRTRALRQRAQQRIRDIEPVLNFQETFSDLALSEHRARRSDETQSLWVRYGENFGLVSLDSSITAMAPLAVFVRTELVWTAMIEENARSNIFPGEPSLLSGRIEEGNALGPSFPDLRVAFKTQSDATPKLVSLQFVYYLVALLLVLSITFFSAFLLWRDVRRGLNLAAMRSQFVASVSHELKTPLTSIRMFAETLRLGRSVDPNIQEEFLGTIVSESERLTRLLNNVLDFSKIEQGEKRYNPVPTPLAEVVEAAVRAMRYPLAQQGFELSVDITDDLPMVSVDRDAIEQAILNLLANALKYSGDHRKIDLQLSRRNGEALIKVKDGGIGIDPGEHSNIFEKFYRANTPENESLSGTGLGLALVDHIAKAHGGRVDVESVLGQGSTFTIHLPLERRL